MAALDFVLYCLGVSVVMLSVFGSIRLVRRRGASAVTEDTKQVALPESDLEARLRHFQQTRFASPIVRRQLTRAPEHMARKEK